MKISDTLGRFVFGWSKPLRTFAPVITNVQEWLKFDWLAKEVLSHKCVREGCFEQYGRFPVPNLTWPRCRSVSPIRYTYRFRKADVRVKDGACAVAGKWLVGESVGCLSDAVYVSFSLAMARPFLGLMGMRERVGSQSGGPYALLRPTGYYHFIMESLVELLYSLKCFPDASVLIDEKNYCGFYREYVELLEEKGIMKGKVFARRPMVGVEDFVMTSVEPDSGIFCKSTIDLLRAAFLSDKCQRVSGRRIFVTRNGRRRFVNQTELEKTAEKMGLEVVDTEGMRVREQIELFSSADLIVANHGAGLTNLIYAAPGASVIELFSRVWLNDCYFRMAMLQGLEYRCLVTRDAAGGFGSIDIHEFETVVAEMLKRTPHDG